MSFNNIITNFLVQTCPDMKKIVEMPVPKKKKIIIIDDDSDDDDDIPLVIPKKLTKKVIESDDDKLIRYEKIIKELMNKHKLRGWSFAWNTRSTTTAGWCKPKVKRIEVIKAYALKTSYDDFKDTVLHEIAHALVGTEHGHDAVWKAKAIEIGCSGDACHEVVFTDPKYVIVCGCKNKERNRYKMCPYVAKVKARRYTCTVCNQKLRLKN